MSGAENIQFNCTQCSAPLNAMATQVGALISCSSCQSLVRVPDCKPELPVASLGAPAARVGNSAAADNQPAAPGPAVVSQVENVAPVQVGSVHATAPVESHVPMASSPSMNAEPVSSALVAAQSMNISHDPSAVHLSSVTAADPTAPSASANFAATPDAPQAGGAAVSAYGEGSYVRPRSTGASLQPPKSPARKVVAAVSVVLFLSVGSVVGISVRNGMERNRLESEIKALIDNAELSFSSNDVAGAVQESKKAQQVLSSSASQMIYVPFDTLVLDPEKTKKWQARIQHFTQTKTEIDQLAAIFSDVEKDLPGVRSQLESKKSLYGAVTPDNQPLVAKVESFLADVAKLEIKRKHEKLRAALEAANALYVEGDIEGAADRAHEIAAAFTEKPLIQDVDLEKRVNILVKRAEQLNRLKSIRLAARSETYDESKRKLQSELAKLDEDNEDLKPLCKRIVQLKSELVLEEKRSRKLNGDDATELRAIAVALGTRDRKLAAGTVEGDTIGLTYDSKALRMGMQRTALSKNLFLEVEGHRLLVEAKDIERRTPRVVAHALALGEAMKKAGVEPDEIWNAADEAPLLSARRSDDDGKEYVFLGDKLYIGKPQEKTASEKEVEAEFSRKAEALALAVENDSVSIEEVRRVVSVAVRATHKEAEWHDHLPGEFVRKVVAEGYIEANMPGAGERLKNEIEAYKEAYGKISNPQPRFSGATPQGDEATELRTFEDHAVWRLYSKQDGMTTFAIKNPDDEKGCLFILYDFPGKHVEFPADISPKTVRMTHQAVGVTATYDYATGKLSFDRATWDKAATFESPTLPAEYRKNKGFGPPAWSLPPHVLLVDQMGTVKSMVTPFGRVDVQDFNKIQDKAKRMLAMDNFLDKLATVLPTADYLHLYFRYFFEYTLDSPITSNTSLLGSRAHCGDIHQTTYQSLERLMGGSYVGDCDDLAEFFVNITRRQNKLSYVMALPQHAACGWVEKPDGASEYTFYVLDTGPPRMFQERELDKGIEMACRAYDEDRTMRFDPKSLGFLFRFNGEPTRTPYYLSSRMYTDREYGEAMEKVQSYWHFHFYALGIKTMIEMIAKGDRVPENCIELAGLYGQVREAEESIKWTTDAMKQLGSDDRMSRMSEQFRIGMLWREEHNNEKAYEAVKGMLEDLKRLQNDRESMNYFSMRLQLMGLLDSIDRPWEAWDLVKKDMYFFAQRNMLRIEHAGGLTGLYKSMKELQKKGRVLTAEETEKLGRLEELLKWFYSKALFTPEDDFNDYMRKYAFVGMWMAGRHGQERLVTELLKGGPFPDPAVKRNHGDRKDPEAEDWNWVRLALPSYSLAIGDALDLDEPPEKWRREEAVKLIDAMVKAANEAKKFGSLSSSEFQLLSSRVFRAFLMKDWADLEKVFAEVQERDWARLTTDIAETFGRSARFISPEEFVKQYRLFAKYIKPRPAYFTVIYEAYRAEAVEHALQACKVALEAWPGDEDMKREAEYLTELARKKAARKKESSPAGDKILPPMPVRVD